ncbi:MAG: dihydropteroate synthase, partial [Acidimicrobiia bacterium]|nr:dihydropteroate synthase [Acidimicrobiia bacterium]
TSEPTDRLEGSLAVATWAAHEGAAMVRVHDVAPTAQAMRVVAA